MPSKRNTEQVVARKSSRRNPKKVTTRDINLKGKAHLNAKMNAREKKGGAAGSKVQESKMKAIIRRQIRDASKRNKRLTVKQTTTQAKKQTSKTANAQQNVHKAPRKAKHGVKQNAKQCNNTTIMRNRKLGKIANKQASAQPKDQHKGKRTGTTAKTGADSRSQKARVPIKLKILSRMKLLTYEGTYFTWDHSYTAHLRGRHMLVGNFPSNVVDLLEVPSGKTVMSSPLPNGVNPSCYKMQFPNGDIMLFRTPTTYILDSKGRQRYSHTLDYDVDSPPYDVTSQGVVYRDRKKDEIRIRAKEDHNKVLTLKTKASYISACDNPQDGKIAIVDKINSSLEIFTATGDLIHNTKLKYTPAYCKSLITFNNVIAVIDNPGKALHFHSWTTGKDLGALYDSDFELAPNEEIFGVGATSGSSDDSGLMDELNVWVKNNETKWHKIISYKMIKFI